MVRAFAVLLAICMLAASALAADPPKLIAEGDWSKPVADSRGILLRGRLVLYEKPRADNYREVVLYVELQDPLESVGNGMRVFCDMGKHDFRPEYKGGLKCELRDKNKKLIQPAGFPFSGGVPKSEWISLPPDATIRLRATPFGIRREKAIAICPDLGSMWVVADGDANEYSLSGTFTVDPAADQTPKGDGHVWRGTIELPPLKIVNKRAK
jgi:hypothetical protein